MSDETFLMPKITVRRTAPLRLFVFAFVVAIAPIAPARGGDWIEFVDDTAARIVADPSVGTADNQEKDYAVGDVDKDCWTDLVVVRKVPFTNPGGRRNVLFMNENGVLTDRSATLAPAFLDATDDRDVQLVDVDGDTWLDIVTAGTFGQAPRVLRNLGRDLDGDWLGFAYEPARIPSFPIPPNFCSVAAGDVTGDGFADLYFVNYVINSPNETRLNDRLLINNGFGSFVDETVTRLTPEMVDSVFGTSALIADWNLDGINEILKVNSSGPFAGDPNVAIFYQDGAGFFDFRHQINDIAPYMAATADFTKDGRLDLVVVDDGQDRYMVNTGNDVQGRAQFSITSVVSTGTTGFGGSARFADFDGDTIPDAIIADVDVDIPGFDRRLAILRGTGTPPTVSLTESLTGCSQSSCRPWTRNGTFDAVGMHVDRDGRLDLVTGSFDGMRVFLGVGQNIAPDLFADGFEIEHAGCWSSLAP